VEPVSTRPALPTCYRHPDRETRLACPPCGRPACVECLEAGLEGSDPQRPACPECAAQRRDVAAAPAGTGGGAPVAFAILVIAVVVFVGGWLLPELWQRGVLAGAQINERVAAGEYYRLVTAAFLHAGLTHILFNMWALYLFGPPLERQVGSLPFAALYFSSAVTGGALYFLLGGPGVAVGASGAIFGLFGAWVAGFWRNRHAPGARQALHQLFVLLAINAALPLAVPAIAWEAHLGGFLAGVAIVTLWAGAAGRPEHGARRIALAVAVGVLALVAVITA
jgi:membrane associated rhomboid family serine protease